MSEARGRLARGLLLPLLLLRRLISGVLLSILWFYRHAISPFTPPSCRFAPTCSAYAQEAIVRHGPLRGGALAFLRVMRCHPFSSGGHDPVPGTSSPDAALVKARPSAAGSPNAP